jgi:hypothetical protein
LVETQPVREAPPAADPAPVGEVLSFPRQLDGLWKLISLGPGTCTYRAAVHFAEAAFGTPPELLCEPDFAAAKRRAQLEARSLILLPCVHEVFAELYASPHWELLDGYWFHVKNPPLYLAGHPQPRGQDRLCAALTCLRPLLANPDGTYPFDFLDVQTTQEAARRVMERRCAYCITNVYGVERHGVKVLRELKCINIGWYLFRYMPQDWLSLLEGSG